MKKKLTIITEDIHLDYFNRIFKNAMLDFPEMDEIEVICDRRMKAK
jgi:hypothetical protein